MRGSDPDAAVYYLAKMLYAGEDVKFIARRIMILASEDIGNADPQAICVAAAAAQAVERVGMPESQIILSQAAAYMACAPKSNSAVNAIAAAMDSVKKNTDHCAGSSSGRSLRRSRKSLAKESVISMPTITRITMSDSSTFPSEIQNEHFYELSDMGYEKTLKNT